MKLSKLLGFLLLWGTICSEQATTEENSRSDGAPFLQQSWQELLESVLSEGSENNNRMLRVYRFAGQLEGHMGVEAPQEWLRAFSTLQPLSSSYWRIEESKQQETKISNEGAMVQLSQGSESVLLPRGELGNASVGHTFVFNSSNSHTIVAEYNNYSVTPLKVKAFGISGVKLWELDRKLLSRIPVSSRGFHSLYLKVERGYVYAFGIEFNGIYVAKIELSSGRLVEIFDACL